MTFQVSYPSSFRIHEVTLVKSKESTKIGLSLRKRSNKATVEISGVSETSPLRDTAIRAGQLLIGVNGDADLPTAATAVKLMYAASNVKLLVCERPSSQCIQVVAAPFFKHSPGICFSSTRGGSLVSVSKVMKRGCFAGTTRQAFLNKGDIVLAVNGIPVSKPEEANRALRVPLADGSLTVLHTIDMAQLRSSLSNLVDQSKLYKGVSIGFKPDKQDPSQQWMVCRLSKKQKSTACVEKTFPILYDSETQHMFDPRPHINFFNSGSAFVAGSDANSVVNSWYTAGACRFMSTFNHLMDANLDGIEDNAIDHSWRVSTQLTKSASFSEQQQQQRRREIQQQDQKQRIQQEEEQQPANASPICEYNVVPMEETEIYAPRPPVPPIKVGEDEQGLQYLSC